MGKKGSVKVVEFVPASSAAGNGELIAQAWAEIADIKSATFSELVLPTAHVNLEGIFQITKGAQDYLYILVMLLETPLPTRSYTVHYICLKLDSRQILILNSSSILSQIFSNNTNKLTIGTVLTVQIHLVLKENECYKYWLFIDWTRWVT